MELNPRCLYVYNVSKQITLKHDIKIHDWTFRWGLKPRGLAASLNREARLSLVQSESLWIWAKK